jgi:hypothetical protein
MTIIDEIAAERRRQVEVEGWSLEHDDDHIGGDLARAGAAYAAMAGLRSATQDGGDVDTSKHICPLGWPWSAAWWKPKTVRRDLVRAAALIVAEIERLDRTKSPHHD